MSRFELYCSPLCETDPVLYREYLETVRYIVSCYNATCSEASVALPRLAGNLDWSYPSGLGRVGSDDGRSRGTVFGVGDAVVPAGTRRTVANDVDARDDAGTAADVSGSADCIASGRSADLQGARVVVGGSRDAHDGAVDFELGGREIDSTGSNDGKANGATPGRWAKVNRNKKLRRKQKKLDCRSDPALPFVPEWRRKSQPTGFCETVLSQPACPSYSQALSDAEKEAKESLARRRAAENAVAEKLAKMKLESLEDEQKCQEYAELKHQRIIQWTNEATAKSQQSLEKCKSIDPSSSASQYEIRRQAKELADLKVEHGEFVRRVAEVVPNCSDLLDACKMPGTATMEFYEAQGGCDADDDSVNNEDDLDRLIRFRKATSGADLTKPRFQNLTYDPFAGEE